MLKNPYTTRPDEVEKWDVFVYVVKAMVGPDGGVRLYRCPWREDFEPQGQRMYSWGGERIAADLFPVLFHSPLTERQFKCEWREVPGEDGLYKTDCGEMQRTDQSPENEGFSYCPYCGRRIQTP
jgi:hypothetical protein